MELNYILYGVAIIAVVLVVIPTVVVLTASFLRSRKYPEKSFKHALINTILVPIRVFKAGPFAQGKITIEKACKYAIKKTGFTDFDGSDFLTVYNAIMNSPTHQAQKVTNLGFISARVEMNMTMVRRLKFIDYLKKNPKVLSTPVPGPVFVMGLPRTGTTFLHRLLSLDPAVRSPLLWELYAPVPGVPLTASKEEMNKDLFKRSEFMRKLIQTRMSLGDKALQHIHEIGYDLPEECLLSLSDELPTNPFLFFSSYMEGDRFLNICQGRVVDNAYKHYKKVLQLLSSQRGDSTDPKRWVLKCPIHLFFIKSIANAFPDAKLIWTHRDPVSAVPSLCSLLKSFHQVYFESECRDDTKLGKTLYYHTANVLEQAPKDIAQTGLPCANITYNDVIDDPIKVVKQIYAQFGWIYSDEYDRLLKKYLEEDKLKREEIKLKRKKKGFTEEVLHKYEPEEFGLTAEELSVGKYADYKTKFNVPPSKN